MFIINTSIRVAMHCDPTLMNRPAAIQTTAAAKRRRNLLKSSSVDKEEIGCKNCNRLRHHLQELPRFGRRTSPSPSPTSGNWLVFHDSRDGHINNRSTGSPKPYCVAVDAVRNIPESSQFGHKRHLLQKFSCFGACPSTMTTLRSPKVSMASTFRSNEVGNLKKPFSAPSVVHVQVTHSMPPQKTEIFKSLESWAHSNILVHLKPVEKSWQPQDFLPDSTSEGFHEQLLELREQSKEIPDEYFVALVGDMITEEALPTYQTMLNTVDGIRDETGASPTSWGIWTRAWTAEENRHGDLLNKYLYLSGRVDMRQIEKTIQYLIGSGMDPMTENNPYLMFIYTSFQERATFISHVNTARHAKERGDSKLAKICGTIAADEKRHEIAYSKIVGKLFEIDPDDTVLAFENMMRKKIAMPAHLMYDGQDDNLFDHFSAVAQRLGVYTAKDYADILEHLVQRWNVEKLTGLSAEGRNAQEYVCNLPARYRRLGERAQGRAKQGPKIPFSWIFGRDVSL